MEAEKDIFLIVSEHKRQMVQILFLTSRNTYFNSFLKHFLEKNVSELLNTFFFKFCPTLEVNNRTAGDNNGTIEQQNDFMSFFHCLMIYYRSTKFHLPSFLYLGGRGGHFDSPLVSKKTTLVFLGLG